MVLSDFLSRQNHDNSSPHEIIPISFNMFQVLHKKYYNIGNTEKYLIQTQSQTKSSGIKLPEVWGMRKNLDLNILPEKQHTNPIKGNMEKPSIGQSRAGMRRRRPSPINQTIIQPSDLSQKIPGAAEIETRIANNTNSMAPAHAVNNANEGMTHRRPLPADVLFYRGPTYRPTPKPIRSCTTESHESSQSLNSPKITNIDPGINFDFKKHSAFQEEVISEIYQRPSKSFFQEPQEFGTTLSTKTS